MEHNVFEGCQALVPTPWSRMYLKNARHWYKSMEQNVFEE
jgi:hypothetical protein